MSIPSESSWHGDLALPSDTDYVDQHCFEHRVDEGSIIHFVIHQLQIIMNKDIVWLQIVGVEALFFKIGTLKLQNYIDYCLATN